MLLNASGEFFPLLPGTAQLRWKHLPAERRHRNAFLNFNLMVAAGDEPTSASRIRRSRESRWSFPMPNTSVKIAVAVLLVLATPAVSYAQFARSPGSAATGNVPISGIARGPANAGGLNNVAVDPSGIGNASRMAPLPQPHISAPSIPKFK